VFILYIFRKHWISSGFSPFITILASKILQHALFCSHPSFHWVSQTAFMFSNDLVTLHLDFFVSLNNSTTQVLAQGKRLNDRASWLHFEMAIERLPTHRYSSNTTHFSVECFFCFEAAVAPRHKPLYLKNESSFNCISCAIRLISRGDRAFHDAHTMPYRLAKYGRFRFQT